MRGSDEVSGSLFSYVDLEDRIPGSHPLRKIRAIVNKALLAEPPGGVCNVSIYRQADFRSLRSSGTWFEILERQESAYSGGK